MHLEDLNLFVRVAQTHSLSEAARQLDQTPSAVSARLKRIEEELGVRLVERTTRSLRLTPEGERFLQTCDTMTLAWTRGQSLLRQDARAVEGRIHIAAPSDTSAQFLADWIGDYIRAHPRLAVTLRVGDRMHDIPREAVDIAVRYGELADSSMVSRTLVRARRVLVASPEYLERSAPLLCPADLANHRCLAWLTRDQPKVQWTFGSPAGSSETIVVKPALCGDGLLVRLWALRGDGVAYKANIDVAVDLRAGRLTRLLSQYEGELVPISAVMPSGRHVPTRVRAMLDYLAKRFAEL
ncbi:MAG: LysR family transcriptional regulator [Gemmatimonadaceae bacterium]